MERRAEVGERAGTTWASMCTLAIAGLACLVLPGTARAQSHVVGWGSLVFDSRWNDEPFVEIAAGGNHTVARRSDGSVVAWGSNSWGQCNVPVLPIGLAYVAIAAGGRHTVARRSDGSVVAWGYNNWGQCNVPALPGGLTYVEVAAGSSHTVARRSNGSVIAWGDNASGQCNVPALPAGLSYVEIAAGYAHTVARRSDGSVVAWGSNALGQCSVPALPAGLTYVGIAAGALHTVARRSNATSAAWGDNSSGQCNVPALPAGLAYLQAAAANYQTVAEVGVGATALSLGAGCQVGIVPPLPAPPTLTVSPPVLGAPVVMSVTDAPYPAPGLVFISEVPGSPLSIYGCTVYLDPATFSQVGSIPTTPGGGGSFMAAVPATPALLGVEIAMQVLFLPSSGGGALTNGYTLTIGYSSPTESARISTRGFVPLRDRRSGSR